jgi:hypothetical protein
MKTAMQEAIKEIAELWSSPSDRPNYTQIFKVLESKLEKEKEQIMNAAKSCNYIGGATDIEAEKYYNQTYNN